MCLRIITIFDDGQRTIREERCDRASARQLCSTVSERTEHARVIELRRPPKASSSKGTTNTVIHQRKPKREFTHVGVKLGLKGPEYRLEDHREKKSRRSADMFQHPKDGGSYGLPTRIPRPVPPHVPDAPPHGTYLRRATYNTTAPSTSSTRGPLSENLRSLANDSGYESIPVAAPVHTEVVVPGTTTSSTSSTRGRGREIVSIPVPPDHTHLTVGPSTPLRVQIPDRDRVSTSSTSSSYPLNSLSRSSRTSSVSHPGLSHHRHKSGTTYRDSALGTSVGSPGSPNSVHRHINLPPSLPSVHTSTDAPTEAETHYERNITDRGAGRERLREIARLQREQSDRETRLHREEALSSLEGRSTTTTPRGGHGGSGAAASAAPGPAVPRPHETSGWRSTSPYRREPRRFNDTYGYYNDDGDMFKYSDSLSRRSGDEGSRYRAQSPYLSSNESIAGSSLRTRRRRERREGEGQGAGMSEQMAQAMERMRLDDERAAAARYESGDSEYGSGREKGKGKGRRY